MAKRNRPETQNAGRVFKHSRTRRGISLETLESRQLLSAAPMIGFHADGVAGPSSLEVRANDTSLRVGDDLIAPMNFEPLQLPGSNGPAVLSSDMNLRPFSKSLKTVPWTDSSRVFTPDAIYTGGKDQNNSATPGRELGGDSEPPQYEFPDSNAPDLGYPGSENIEPYQTGNGGFTPNYPPSPIEGSTGEFNHYEGTANGEFVNRDVEEVIDMLASLQYVPGDKRESTETTSHLPAESQINSGDEAEARVVNTPGQPTPSDGGMIELSTTAVIQSNGPTDGGPTIDFEQLLAAPAQIDTARGNYQAFEISTEEAEPVSLDPVFESSAVYPSVEVEWSNNSAREAGAVMTGPGGEAPWEEHTAGGVSALPLAAATESGFTGIRTLNTAGAIAIVVLASRVSRVREDEHRTAPAPATKLGIDL